MAERTNLRVVAVVVMVVLIGTGSAWADLSDGLIAHWKLDGNATDSAGTNDGTLVNGPTWAAGQIGDALSFDGFDDYVDLGNDNSLKPSLPVTISAWIKLSVLGLDGQIIGLDDQSSRYYGIWIHTGGSNRIAVGYGDGGSHSYTNRRSKGGTTALEADVWYHVTTVVKSATDMVIYINGVNDGGQYSGTGGNLSYSNRNSSIGSRLGLSIEFNGSVDDVRVYNRALSAGEVEELYHGELLSLEVVGPGEVAEDFHAQYKAIADYELVSGVDVTDSAECVWSVEPNSNCDIAAGLLMTEMVDLPTDVVITAKYSEGDVNEVAEKDVSILTICPSGSALEFDGVNDYVRVEDSDSLDVSGAIVITAWLKGYDFVGNGSHNGNPIVTKWQTNSIGQYHLAAYVDGSIVFRIADGTANDKLEAINVLTTDKWCHVAAWWDGSFIRIFVNGLLVNEKETSITRLYEGNYNEDYLQIGYDTGGSYPYWSFKGLIDEVRIYDRALSAEEIWAGMHRRPEAGDPNLVGYWDFDEGEGQVAGDSAGGNDGQLGNTDTPDGSDPNWVDSVPPVGICSVEGIVERNLLNVFGMKNDVLDILDAAIGKEVALWEYMDIVFEDRNFGNTKKGDVVKAKQKIMGAIQQEEQAEAAVDNSLDKLDDAMDTLGIE